MSLHNLVAKTNSFKLFSVSLQVDDDNLFHGFVWSRSYQIAVSIFKLKYLRDFNNTLLLPAISDLVHAHEIKGAELPFYLSYLIGDELVNGSLEKAIDLLYGLYALYTPLELDESDLTEALRCCEIAYHTALELGLEVKDYD